MSENTLWHKASQIKMLTAPHIVAGFDIGFDSKIPEETKDALMHSVRQLAFILPAGWRGSLNLSKKTRNASALPSSCRPSNKGFVVII